MTVSYTGEERRHQSCDRVVELKGQVTILKWVLGFVLAAVITIGGFLWSRIDEVKMNAMDIGTEIRLTNQKLEGIESQLKEIKDYIAALQWLSPEGKPNEINK
jgi:hypothetical protein